VEWNQKTVSKDANEKTFQAWPSFYFFGILGSASKQEHALREHAVLGERVLRQMTP
jgi:hypothetical protein